MWKWNLLWTWTHQHLSSSVLVEVLSLYLFHCWYVVGSALLHHWVTKSSKSCNFHISLCCGISHWTVICFMSELPNVQTGKQAKTQRVAYRPLTGFQTPGQTWRCVLVRPTTRQQLLGSWSSCTQWSCMRAPKSGPLTDLWFWETVWGLEGQWI